MANGGHPRWVSVGNLFPRHGAKVVDECSWFQGSQAGEVEI